MITQKQLQNLEQQGFLLVENILNPEKDLEPVLDEMASILDGLAAELYSSSQLSSLYTDLPFGKRLTAIIGETGQSHSQHFDCSLPKGRVGATAPMYLGSALFNLITNVTLLDCIQDILGPEIYSNPVQHARLKPPESVVPEKAVGMSVLVGETPWHQDNAVLTQDADDTEMLTVWIPLVDATVENGCLVVIPGSHRPSENGSSPANQPSPSSLVRHCPGPGGAPRIPDSVIEFYLRNDKVVPVPMARGSVLIFHRRLVHASLPNLSGDLRSSLDLRYQPIGQPTGRDVFPGFIVRSSASKENTLRSRDEMERLWKQSQKRMSSEEYMEQPFDRWQSDHPMCA